MLEDAVSFDVDTLASIYKVKTYSVRLDIPQVALVAIFVLK